jgi:hypothetical protein
LSASPVQIPGVWSPTLDREVHAPGARSREQSLKIVDTGPDARPAHLILSELG